MQEGTKEQKAATVNVMTRRFSIMTNKSKHQWSQPCIILRPVLKSVEPEIAVRLFSFSTAGGPDLSSAAKKVPVNPGLVFKA